MWEWPRHCDAQDTVAERDWFSQKESTSTLPSSWTPQGSQLLEGWPADGKKGSFWNRSHAHGHSQWVGNTSLEVPPRGSTGSSSLFIGPWILVETKTTPPAQEQLSEYPAFILLSKQERDGSPQLPPKHTTQGQLTLAPTHSPNQPFFWCYPELHPSRASVCHTHAAVVPTLQSAHHQEQGRDAKQTLSAL